MTIGYYEEAREIIRHNLIKGYSLEQLEAYHNHRVSWDEVLKAVKMHEYEKLPFRYYQVLMSRWDDTAHYSDDGAVHNAQEERVRLKGILDVLHPDWPQRLESDPEPSKAPEQPPGLLGLYARWYNETHDIAKVRLLIHARGLLNSLCDQTQCWSSKDRLLIAPNHIKQLRIKGYVAPRLGKKTNRLVEELVRLDASLSPMMWKMLDQDRVRWMVEQQGPGGRTYKGYLTILQGSSFDVAFSWEQSREK